MGASIQLTASDGFTLGAYEARPDGTPRGAVVIVQEIFGVNAHIKRVADGYAADGYHVIAPAIFDRAERNIELGYGPADRDRGIALRKEIPLDATLLDVAAAGAALASSGKVALVGYCFGGSLAWLTATRLPGFTATVGYYGGMIAAHVNETPRVPVMLHFGEHDAGIPLSDVEKIRTASDPALVEIFTYPAGHAFNRDGNEAYNAHCAVLARMRTMTFLAGHVG